MTSRRNFIAVFGALTAGPLAGCLSERGTTDTPTQQQDIDDTHTPTNGIGNGTNTPTETATETPTPTETTSVTPTLQAKLAPDDSDRGYLSGPLVAVSNDGTTAIMGNGAVAEGGGSAYVFGEADGTWSQQTTLVPDNGESNDRFGEAVAVSSDGSTTVVGASGDNEAAYVFRVVDGTWKQQATLTPDDGDSDDLFGAKVAVSGDGATAIIGAQNDDTPNGEDAGAAYVFGEADGTWSQQAKLTPEDGDSEDLFGVSVAVSSDGSTAIIGADGDEDPNGERAGAAYVFREADGTWSQQTKLAPEDGDSEDLFGVSVEVSGDGATALIGAYWDEDPNGEKAGSAYVFGKTDGTWSQQAKLDADDGDSRDWFGSRVAMSADGSTAIIGAINDEAHNGERSGSVYVFGEAGGDWSQWAKLTSDDDAEDMFGSGVALSGDGATAIIGAWTDEDQNGSGDGTSSGPGSAYVFNM